MRSVHPATGQLVQARNTFQDALARDPTNVELIVRVAATSAGTVTMGSITLTLPSAATRASARSCARKTPGRASDSRMPRVPRKGLDSPSMVRPGVDTRLASQIDVPPTILDLLGASGDDHFFGQGLFEDAHLPARAFISNYQELGYYKDGMLTVLLPKRRVEAFRIDPETFAATPAEPDPVLLDEAIAYYQTASRAFRTGKLRSPDYPSR